ncbi:MAG TPA: SDR family NAD(P)-dependent oxidoreductase [Solirubrobacteraceae bacterium]|nr:SDR family NAD(P)-dependent oxidoreductase [Solirubrobacteraceae bacterium]
MSIVIVGAGPNLGMAIARRFGREGVAVGLIARNQEKLDRLVTELTGTGITAAAAAADIREPAALTAAIQTLATQLGPVEILEYSPVPAPEFMKPILKTSAEDLRGPLEVSVFGAATAVHAVLEPMRKAGHGTILFTTGTAFITRNPQRAGVGVSFSGEVAYAEMLHKALADEGIHVAHTAINGAIGPGEQFEPDAVADIVWRHHTAREGFQTRLGIDE